MILRTALLSAVMLLGCGAPPPDDGAGDVPTRTERGTFQLQVSVADGALRRGANALRIRAWDASGAPVTLREAVAVMPSHDHERASGVVTRDGDAFRVDDLRLTMPGRWEITLHFAQGARADAAWFVAYVR